MSTENRDAIMKLQISEAQKNAILNGVKANIAFVDKDLKIIWVNKTAAESVKKTPEEMIGFTCHHFWADPSVPCKNCPSLRALETKKQEHVIIHTPDGRVWDESGEPIFDTQGNIIGVVEIATDITESKHADAALRESEEKYRNMHDNLGVGVGYYKLDGTVISYNRLAASHMNGVPEDFIGKSIYDIFQKQEAEFYHNRIKKAALSAQPIVFEDLVQLPSGNKYFLSTFVKITDLNNNISGIQIISQDITERKQAEVALQESEKKYRNLVDNAGETIVVAQDGLLKFVNRMTLDLLGADSEQEIINKPFSGFLHADDLEIVVENYRQRISGKAVMSTYAFRVVALDGRIKWVEIKAVLIDWAGRPATLNFITEITKRKKAEDELQKLNASLEERVRDRTAKLEASNKELESFSYSLAHDLRTPLRAINGYSSILKEEYAAVLDDEGKRLCGNIRAGTERMSQLINELLSFIQLGRAEIKPEEIDMHAMVLRVIDSLMGERRVSISTGQLENASGDKAMIRQVWENLISNAIKFSSKKDFPIIEIGCQQQQSETVYFVRDNGAGFDMNFVHKLFGVFQRLHGVSEFNGTGVGLSLVHRIIQRHGGRVWAEGEVDKGAIFYFSLPVKKFLR